MNDFIGRFCLIRTFSAGVHCGTLRELAGTAAVLTDCRRVWRWRGANSLNELATNGAAKEWTRISEPVSLNLLTQAVEIIPCTETAKKNLSTSRWGS